MQTIILVVGAGLAGALAASVAFGQNVGVNSSSCQVFAGDCVTIVSLTQARSVSIVETNNKAIAECRAVLPGGMFLPRHRRQVQCDFGNTGQTCQIGPISLSTSAADMTSGADTSAEGAAGIVFLSGNAISTRNWKETIQPSGQVAITCRGATPGANSSSSQNVTVVQQQSFD
jgi:hypothetical protein